MRSIWLEASCLAFNESGHFSQSHTLLTAAIRVICVFALFPFVCPGKSIGNLSAGFETDATTQNYLSGWTDANTEQTSQTEPQTGAEQTAGNTG